MSLYLQKLHAEHKARQLKFNPPKRIIRDYGPPISLIIKKTAKYYDVSCKVLKYSRNKIVSSYRWLIFYFCRKILNYTLTKIAKSFKLDHTSVRYGLKRFEEITLLNPKLVLDLRAIRMKVYHGYHS